MIAPNPLNENHLLTLFVSSAGLKSPWSERFVFLQPQLLVPSGSSVSVISFIHLRNIY